MGIELPSPQGEQLGSVGGVERTVPIERIENAQVQQSVERNATESPAPQELRNGQGAGDGNATFTQTDVSNATISSASQPAQSTGVSLDDVPVIAADEDLIEKQWVDSVKRIVKETRTDPYQQGEAIGRLQADYLQKRYGKTITGEGAS